MDGMKSQPDLDSDGESASPQYDPQFISIKEEHMADDDDNEETSHTMKSDDLSDTPDEEMAEAVMFPIVKTEYSVADTSQKDAPDEEVYCTDKNEVKVRSSIHTLCSPF
jgi:hypothetical protein